jgi:hypothetical protein
VRRLRAPALGTKRTHRAPSERATTTRRSCLSSLGRRPAPPEQPARARRARGSEQENSAQRPQRHPVTRQDGAPTTFAQSVFVRARRRTDQSGTAEPLCIISNAQEVIRHRVNGKGRVDEWLSSRNKRKRDWEPTRYSVAREQVAVGVLSALQEPSLCEDRMHYASLSASRPRSDGDSLFAGPALAHRTPA